MNTPEGKFRQKIDEATAFLSSNLPKAAKELLDWHTTGLLDEGGVIRNAYDKCQNILPERILLRIIENIVTNLTLKQYLKIHQRLDNQRK